MMMDDRSVTISEDSPLLRCSWNSDEIQGFKREDLQSKHEICLVFVHGDHNRISDDHVEQVFEFCSNVVDFNQLDESIDYITDLEGTSVFLILCEFQNLDFICLINDIEQIHSIYIFDSQLIHKNYGIGKSNRKVKSIDHQFRHLCHALSTNIQQSLIISKSLSFLKTSSTENGNQLESSFMYTQLFKEIFLELNYDKDKAKTEFLDFCRDSSSPSTFKSKDVDQFEKNYQASNALWWYTKANFLYFNVNQALRTQDVEILLKMGFFIQDLHLNIQQRYNEENNRTPLTLYRGQGLSETDFEKMKNSERGLIGFNSFLSTSRDKDAAKLLADSNRYCSGMIGILFQINVDTSITSTPFTYLGELSQHPDEEEVLFSMHSVFRIGEMTEIEERLWEVNLRLTSETDHDLMCLTERLRKGFTTSNKWVQLYRLLLQLGMIQKAIQVYELAENAHSINPQDACDSMKQILCLLKNHLDSGQYSLSIESCESMIAELPTDSPDGNMNSSAVYFLLGALLECHGDYSGALSKFQKAIELIKDQQQKYPQLSINIYILMGWVQQQMCQYENAKMNYETALKIARSDLRENRLEVPNVLNYLGSLYTLTGNHDKSLAHLNEALTIQEKFLPDVHLEKVKVHSNIGSAHLQMGSYLLALESHKKALDMLFKIDSKDHTVTIKIYGNMGQACLHLKHFDDAKKYCEEALALAKKALPPNHPITATCLNDMATLYGNQGHYHEAIKWQTEALQVQYGSTNLSYMNLAVLHNNMAALLIMGGRHVDALEHANKALENQKRAVPSEHVNMGLSYATIGDAYQCLGKNAQAISNYQRALEILQKFLPSDHPRITSLILNKSVLHMIPNDYATVMNGISQFQKRATSHVALNSDRQDSSPESASIIDNLTETASAVVTNLMQGPNVMEHDASSLLETMTKGFESMLQLAPSDSHLIRLTEKEKASISSLSEGLHSFKTSIDNIQKRGHERSSMPYRGSSSTNVTDTKNFLEDVVGNQVKLLETFRGILPNNHAYPALVANMNGKIYLSSGQYSCALTLFEKAVDYILECEPINEELLTEVQENREKAKEGVQFYAEHFESP